MTQSFRTLALVLFVSIAPLDALAQGTTGDTTTTDTAASDDTSGTTEGTGSNSAFETTEGGLTVRPFFFGAGVGLAVGLRGGSGAAFRIQEHLGYRFLGFALGGRLDGALWIGLSFGQTVGDGGGYLLTFDGMFGADVEVWDGGDAQLLVTPSAGLGGGVFGFNSAFGNFTDGAFHWQFNAQAEIVLLEGLLGIFLRPLGFDFFWTDRGGVNTDYFLLTGVNIRL